VDVRFGWSSSPVDSLRQAAGFAQKSQTLDPARANSYGLLGTIALFSGHCDEAVALSEKAVALEPNGADMSAILGFIMTYCGNPTRAAASLEQAMRLAPYYPDWYRWVLGRAYRQLGRHDDAINALSHGLEALPDALAPRVELAAAYSETDQLTKAHAAAEAVLKINPRFSVLAWVATPHHKDDAVTVREITALRRAGLPD